MQNPNFALKRRNTAAEAVVTRPRETLLLNNWARQDSNLGPRDYESPALTAELQAHLPMKTADSGNVSQFSIDGMLTL